MKEFLMASQVLGAVISSLNKQDAAVVTEMVTDPSFRAMGRVFSEAQLPDKPEFQSARMAVAQLGHKFENLADVMEQASRA